MHADLQTLSISENFMWCRFCHIKGISSCVMLRFSCMFMSPVYVWSLYPSKRIILRFPLMVSLPPPTHTSVFKLHQLLEMNASPGESMLLHSYYFTGRILTLFSLYPISVFLMYFSPRLNWNSGTAADSWSISPKKKHAYFSTRAQLGSQRPAAGLRYALLALLETGNDPFVSVSSYLDNRSVDVGR